MTVSSIKVISDRIAYEKKENGIAVFAELSGKLNAIPVRTLETRRRLSLGAENHVGTYFGPAGAKDFQRSANNLKLSAQG